MSRRKTPPPRRKAVASSVYCELWLSSLDACFILHGERDSEGCVTDFVFDEVNPRGAAALGLAKEAILGRRLCELVPINRSSGLFKRYVHVLETGETLDEECELNLAEINARWVRQQVIATKNGIAIIARDISAHKQKEFEDRQNNAFLQALIDSLPLLICVKSTRPESFGEVVVWNQAAERITGYGEAEIVGGGAHGKSFMPEIAVPIDSTDDGARESLPPAEVAHTFVKRDGTVRELRTRAVPLLDQYGKPEFVLGIGEDVTEHAAALEQVRLASIVFEHATEAIVVSDARDRIVTVNQAFCALTGYFEEEVAGRAATDFETTGIGFRDTARMLEQVEREGSWSGQGAQLRKGGTTFPTWRNVVRVTDGAGYTINYLRIATDITAIQQSREQFERQANHDALTGLPNRRLFMDRLSHALEHCLRSQQKLALLFIDLDNFKAVNDRLGHVIGDELLKEVANRLAHSARAVDTVCRLSGDEFTIVMEDMETVDLGAAGLVAKRIIDALSKPFTLSGHTITASASIGISLYPADGTDADVLIRNADAALYHAKELGRNRYQYFSETIDGKPPDRINIESALGIAIESPSM